MRGQVRARTASTNGEDRSSRPSSNPRTKPREPPASDAPKNRTYDAKIAIEQLLCDLPKAPTPSSWKEHMLDQAIERLHERDFLIETLDAHVSAIAGRPTPREQKRKRWWRENRPSRQKPRPNPAKMSNKQVKQLQYRNLQGQMQKDSKKGAAQVLSGNWQHSHEKSNVTPEQRGLLDRTILSAKRS